MDLVWLIFISKPYTKAVPKNPCNSTGHLRFIFLFLYQIIKRNGVFFGVMETSKIYIAFSLSNYQKKGKMRVEEGRKKREK